MRKLKADKIRKILKNGKPVLLYDGDSREEEIDLVFNPVFVKPDAIKIMRRDAGGLICVALGKEICKRIKLPKMTKILRQAGIDERIIYKRTQYGDEPAFSISINHISCKTGITDAERWKTILEIANICKTDDPINFFTLNFRTPGHVPILVDSGIDKRMGHTELSVELMRILSLPPIATICEMLDTEGRRANLSLGKEYANKIGSMLITKEDIIWGGNI